MEIGFAMCGSFCTFDQVFPVMEELAQKYHVTPIFSFASASVDSRFGIAAGLKYRLHGHRHTFSEQHVDLTDAGHLLIGIM